ncbi:hypothetical protein B0T16DRAFT_456030 [Cercophora newfieldiana]|uniref:2EXR domain-containing protein n=1 Tax=Cercophora newfieldiana TaxID=92897 RepID=A0AA40CS09_9PEZI|nr:hypothetical protein B0T16DRAFT_456030 [Cercophora newfieldiana]
MDDFTSTSDSRNLRYPTVNCIGMATSSHQFPRLPLELREEIWKFVVRPAQPGAHYFRVCLLEDSKDISTQLRQMRARLAAPQCLPRGVEFTADAQKATPISWTANNTSVYLTDYGLLTACKETRLVIGIILLKVLYT